MTPRTITALVLASALALAAPAPAQTAHERQHRALQQQLVEAFTAEDYAAARDLAETLAERQPDNPVPRYNLAAALAMLGETQQAEHALADALDRNFQRFHDLVRDPHMAPLRHTETYRLATENRRSLLDAAAHAAVERFEREHADTRYTFTEDTRLRIKKIAAYPTFERNHAFEQMQRVAAFAEQHFPAFFEHEPHAPPPWIIAILPTREHFVRLTGRPGGVGGVYDHNRRTLTARDLGPSLRHEFFHALHWRHIERTGRLHPIWIREGLASLFEDMRTNTDGTVTFLPNARTNIVRRRAEAKRLTPLQRLANLNHRRFHNSYARTHYAEARALFMYLHHRDALAEWYRRYSESFDHDPTGLQALAATLGEDLDAIQAGLTDWARQLPRVAEPADPFGASLGVELDRGQGFGPTVKTFGGRRGTDAPADTTDRLRYNDALFAIDGTPTPTLPELVRVLGHYQPGDTARINLRRRDRRHTVTIELTEIEDR